MGDEQLLDTLGLKLVAGRDFSADELVDSDSAEAPNSKVAVPSAIITAAWPTSCGRAQNPLGKTFYSWGDMPIRVVGVVEHLVRPMRAGRRAGREYSVILPMRARLHLAATT